MVQYYVIPDKKQENDNYYDLQNQEGNDMGTAGFHSEIVREYLEHVQTGLVNSNETSIIETCFKSSLNFL